MLAAVLVPRSAIARSTGAAPPYAQAAAADSGAAPADSAAVRPDSTAMRPRDVQLADSVATFPPDTAARTVPRRGWSDQPRVVMLRSLLVPGWGQAHNRAWVKAVLVAGGETALGVLTLNDWRESQRLYDRAQLLRTTGSESDYDGAVAEYNARLDQLVRREWLLGALVVYSLIDAYVDANFRGFEVEFRKDPALPEGPPGDLSARVSYRWTF